MTTGGVHDDVTELYVAALAVFGNQVRSVNDDEWDLPTPCDEWSVRDVVAHVVLGEAHLPGVLAAETAATQVEFSAELLGPVPLTTWRGTALKAIEAAKIPGVAETVYRLDLGEVSGTQLLSYRITDNLVHAWDISVAVGRTEPIDETHAEWLLEFWEPVGLAMGESTFFGPPLEPPTAASASDRLLALLGRET